MLLPLRSSGTLRCASTKRAGQTGGAGPQADKAASGRPSIGSARPSKSPQVHSPRPLHNLQRGRQSLLLLNNCSTRLTHSRLSLRIPHRDTFVRVRGRSPQKQTLAPLRSLSDAAHTRHTSRTLCCIVAPYRLYAVRISHATCEAHLVCGRPSSPLSASARSRSKK